MKYRTSAVATVFGMLLCASQALVAMGYTPYKGEISKEEQELCITEKNLTDANLRLTDAGQKACQKVLGMDGAKCCFITWNRYYYVQGQPAQPQIRYLEYTVDGARLRLVYYNLKKIDDEKISPKPTPTPEPIVDPEDPEFVDPANDDDMPKASDLAANLSDEERDRRWEYDPWRNSDDADIVKIQKRIDERDREHLLVDNGSKDDSTDGTVYIGAVIVNPVRPGSIFAKMGLNQGDVIVSVNGNRINVPGDLQGIKAGNRIGFIRGDKLTIVANLAPAGREAVTGGKGPDPETASWLSPTDAPNNVVEGAGLTLSEFFNSEK